MRWLCPIYLSLAFWLPGQTPPAPAAKVSKTVFHVKYIGHDSVYIDGGTADNLAEGMLVEITRRAPGAPLVDTKPVGSAIVRAVATHSAVCEVQKTTLKPEAGDEVRLSAADEIVRARAEVTKTNRKYLQVIEFTGSDPIEEEQKAYAPKEKRPEPARTHFSIAFERNQISDHDAHADSAENGAVIRVDWKRIGGSFWTATGYWRGSLTTSSATQTSTTSLLDLYNRTYQIGLFYANPLGHWNFGVGRLYVPGAVSLGVVDGTYLSRRFNKAVSASLFAGTNPDPTQWNYAPGRETAGTLIHFDAGKFDAVRYTGSFGVALTRRNLRPERQFVFAENTLSFGRHASLYQTVQADQRNPKLDNGATGAQLSTSFSTLRLQPFKRLSFDFNHNYLRGVPTFDQRLLGTGLVDQYLFTGFSGGIRLEPISQLFLAATWGQSRKNGDTTHSVNQYYSVGWRRLPYINSSVEARYSKFTSTFGVGSYESMSLSRSFFDSLRIRFEGGIQDIHSALSSQGNTKYFNTLADWQMAKHYFTTGGWLFYRGSAQNYDQVYFSVGYRLR